MFNWLKTRKSLITTNRRLVEENEFLTDHNLMQQGALMKYAIHWAGHPDQRLELLSGEKRYPD